MRVVLGIGRGNDEENCAQRKQGRRAGPEKEPRRREEREDDRSGQNMPPEARNIEIIGSTVGAMENRRRDPDDIEVGDATRVCRALVGLNRCIIINAATARFSNNHSLAHKGLSANNNK